MLRSLGRTRDPKRRYLAAPLPLPLPLRLHSTAAAAATATNPIISETLAAQAAYAHGPRLEALPAREETATAPLHKASFTILPPPIPDDKQSRISYTHLPPGSSASSVLQSELYPSTGLLDAISLISVCLRKRETTERGYEIFKRILEDVKSGRCAVPDASVWSSVISGILQLAPPTNSQTQTTAEDSRKAQVLRRTGEQWARRARDLVGQWETLNGSHVGTPAGLNRGGDKVYAGWITGLISYVPIPTHTITATAFTHTPVFTAQTSH